ncbi:MAG: proprotein convertase P-domain-containing protein [Polyangiaceae bacterium]|nr:proprotein convertase P-domain-containing protein [Polyangiaceae bacterium]
MFSIKTQLVCACFAVALVVGGCAAEVKPPDPTGGSAGSGGSGGGGTAGEGGTGGAPCTDEVCDGKDNNCDGVVDEGCDCLEGDTEPCYEGPEGTQGVGSCKAGTRTCDAAINKFGPCEGQVLPAESEKCDGLDENCNGQTDDGIPDLMCGIGACMATGLACVNGTAGTCVPLSPTLEICDGVDNDCDQLTDESFPEANMACDSGLLGVCKNGLMQCTGGTTVCMPSQMPSPELCDGLDNDCNGTTDDNIPGTGGDCSTGAAGVCGPGMIMCQGGLVDCFSLVPASPEVCDGLDNDCDGAADEANPEGGGMCNTGQLGACGVGTLNCLSGSLQCTPNASAQTEVCDGVDNNCDGQVDEGSPGAGQACSCGGTSVCQLGKLFCQGCTKEVDCNNGIDDDGDGAIDCADSQCALGCSPSFSCAMGEKLLVLSATDVPKAISDNTTVASVMSFSETAVVKKVALQLNINHTWDSDLDISLKSPANTTVDISSDNGGAGANYQSTIFDDACSSNPAASGTAPFNGCYSPEQPLSTYVNQSVKGTWTLQVGDDAGGDTGSLTAWTLAVCVQ